MTPVERATLATLSYFSLFQVPLTALEAWRNLFWDSADAPPSLADVEAALPTLVAAGRLRAQDGYWYLPDAAPPAERLLREADALRKWRRLRRGTRLLQCVPFLLGAAAVNTLPIGASRRDSDIDLLLISRGGRMFTVRFLTVALTQLFGVRRHGRFVADRLCLSFTVSDRALDLMPLTKKPDDPLLRFWCANAHVLFGRDGIFGRFWEANAALLAPLPNAALRRSTEDLRPWPLTRPVRDALERLLAGRLGDALEDRLRALQMRRFSANTGSRSRRGGTDVVISDDVLKFHERDNREEMAQAWYHRLRRYGLDVPERPLA